jgi:hypothetical protein
MHFEPTTIEHLGAKLYPTLPPVIGELISNAWDAEAKKVEITMPAGPIDKSLCVTVRDFGLGMTREQLQDEYLKIGRNRREGGTDNTPTGTRKLMGRKGLGKLSAFGIADVLEVRTIKERNATCIRLNYQNMLKWPSGEYEPEEVLERSGATSDQAGTEVMIKNLRRTKAIDIDHVREDIGRRFAIIGKSFSVEVNGKQIEAVDRRKDCEKLFALEDTPEKEVVDSPNGWKVTGWIGLTTESSSANRGVDIFVREKAVEMSTMFGLPTTHAQWARAYIVGRINADFLDSGPEDQISTGRGSVQWESEQGQRLQAWGRSTMTWALGKWLDLRKEKKSKALVGDEGYMTWYANRTAREQHLADRLIKSLIDKDEVDPEAVRPLLEAVKANIEFVAFQDLVDDIESTGGDMATLLRLVGDWNLLEAREALKLSDGRLNVTEQLAKYVKTDALEVKKVQPLFRKNPWLVEPGWGDSVRTEATYTKMLEEEFPESTEIPENNRRMDLVAFDAERDWCIVELKRPSHTLARKDLNQIEAYVDWLTAKVLGSEEQRTVRGVLIVGDTPNKGDLVLYRQNLRNRGIEVETFNGILKKAEKVYGEIEGRLKSIAPEYSRTERKERRKRKE